MSQGVNSALQSNGFSVHRANQSQTYKSSINNGKSIVKTPSGIQLIQAQPCPQTKISVQNIPVQKYYTDYEPVVTHQHIAYEREYEEQHQTSLGVSVQVVKTMTDYQTVQQTNFKAIQVPYTDFKQIEIRTEYIPKISYQTVTEHIPANQIDQIIEQHPYKIHQIKENGEQSEILEMVAEQKNVPKQDYITQQRVQQIVEYEEIKTERILSESTILCPQVEEPQPSQIIVQQSIHEPQLNRPEYQQNTEIQQQFITVVNQQQSKFDQYAQITPLRNFDQTDY